MSNIDYAYSWFINKGLSPAAAAGIVGNLRAESGVNPNANQEGGPGMGIAQWSEGARWETLKQWAGNRDPFDLDTQLGFLWHELNTGYDHVLRALRNADSVYEATEVFMKQFEIPADQSDAAVQGRVQLANGVRQDADPNARTAGNAGARKDGGGGGQEYGDYGYVQAFQEKHPEIAELIDKARKQGWTPERLSYEIKDTDWWAKHTEAQRRWALIIAESPAQAEQLRQDQRNALQALAIQSGVRLGPKELDDLANRAAKNEWDEADMRLVLAKRFEMNKNKPLTGTANDAAEIIDRMAWEYGVPVDRATKAKWISQTIAGQLDPASMEDRLREQAKILYGGEVAKQLNNYTLRDIMSPYLQAAAAELGIAPEQMKTTDAKWTKPLTGGAAGLMTLDEWTKTLRSDKRYGWDKTSAAKATAASLAADLGKLMGSAF